MAAELTCALCGTPLPGDAPEGICPTCLMGLALPDAAKAAQSHRTPSEDARASSEKTSALPESDVVERAGTTIGRYKLLQQIGEGGFGVVFMAEQTEPVQRKVALKVVKAGMDTREVIARFEAERQALALMDHPNIAQVLDGGATASGRPYFVMELVRGLPITNYCDHSNLSTRQRLELFIKVCRAVQHAHQKGVIHRDLKPTNVLVTLHDGKPVPKVIDFGVAKALGQKLTDKTLFTRFEQMIGTPAYMSPEQAELSGLDVDTRSDIYSLGVLLYELLTGVTPLDAETLRKAALDEVRRMIRETEPPKPSTRLLTLGERLAEVAKHRHTEPNSLTRQVRGDLDWMTMKALEKDRRRRYETANGLAADIERYLHDEPVWARPPSKGYLLRKFLNRNRLAVGAASAITLALLSGLAVATFSFMRERAARHRAVAAELRQTQLRKEAQAAQATAENEQFKALQNLYAADMSMAYQALERGNLGHVRQLVAKYLSANQTNSSRHGLPGKDPRGWEWRNLWQRSRGEELVVLQGHSNVVEFAGMLADGRTVVSVSRDRTLRFWDLKNRRLLETIRYPEPAYCAALSPDGRWLAVGGEYGYWSLWDPVGRALRFAATNSSPVRGLAFSPDNALLALATTNAVEVWGLESLTLASTIFRPNGNNWKMGITFSPNSKLLAYSEGKEILDTNMLMLCEWASRTTNMVGICKVGHAAGLAFGPDGRLLISGEPTGIWLWDSSSHRLLRHLTDHREGVDDGVCSIALSPNGKLMASASEDHTVRLWDTDSWQEKRVLRGHELAVHSVTFSPDGTKLLTCGIDEAIRVWDVEAAPGRRETYRPPQGWLLMPGAPEMPRQMRIQTGTGGATGIGFFDLKTCEEEGTQVSPIPLAPEQTPDSVSGDLSRLAVLRADGSIELWNTAPMVKVSALPGPPGHTRGIALSRTGGFLALERDNGRVEISNLLQNRTIATLESSEIIGGEPGLGQYYPRLSFWSGDTRFVRITRNPIDLVEVIEVLILPGNQTKLLRSNHKDHVTNFCVSSDGDMIATCAWDGQIRVWSVRAGTETHTLGGQFVGYISVAMSQDGSRLVAGGPDGTITMWDMSSWSQVAHWKAHAGWAARVCFLEDGNLLMTRGLFTTRWGDFETHIWRPPSLADIEAEQRIQGARP